MRVQLRDRNPPRVMAWRYGRSRGKFPHPGLPRHYVDSVGIVSQETSLEKNEKGNPQDHIPGADSVDEGNASPAPVTYPTLLNQSSDGANGPEFGVNHFGSIEEQVGIIRAETPEPTSIDYPRSCHTSPYTKDAHSRHEWTRDTDTSAPLTPAASSYASSVSTAASIPYPVPNMGYYQPQPWMAPFGQQFPYPMPYVAGYPGYPLPAQQISQSFASPSGSESSRQSTGGQIPWAPNGGMYPVRFTF
jgi:hypothetical protein